MSDAVSSERASFSHVIQTGGSRSKWSVGAERSRNVEDCVRALCAGGEYGPATTRIMEAYGPELLRFVRSLCRADADADEVFGSFCEDVWRGLPNFAWRCPVRCWLFKLARHAGWRFVAAPHRRAERNVALTDVSELVEDRSATDRPDYPSELEQELRAMRERLNDEDRTILTLRVDRELGFREIARVLAAPGVELSEAELSREATRVRKRFQLARQRLRRWLGESGLLE